MPEGKELVFLEPSEIPRLTKGAFGRDWFAIFDKIPKGKALKMTEKDYGSCENVRSQVIKYNKAKATKEVPKQLKATQRTDKGTEEKTIYVVRIA